MIDVFSQGYEAALLFCFGIAAGLLFDFETWMRKYAGRLFGHVLDLLYVLICTALLAFGVLLASNGVMRFFYLAAFAIGAWVTGWAFFPIFFGKLQKFRN